jgi:hypothetical protein
MAIASNAVPAAITHVDARTGSEFTTASVILAYSSNAVGIGLHPPPSPAPSVPRGALPDLFQPLNPSAAGFPPGGRGENSPGWSPPRRTQPWERNPIKMPPPRRGGTNPGYGPYLLNSSGLVNHPHRRLHRLEWTYTVCRTIAAHPNNRT